MKAGKDLTRGPIAKTMLLFSLPMILGNMLQQIYSIADTLIVGRFLGSGALAAVGSAYSLITFINSVIIGLAMGCGALFSFDYGAKDKAKWEKDLWNSLLLLASVTVLMEAIALSFLGPILKALHVPAEILEDSYAYTSTIFLGISFVALYNYVAYILKAKGNSTTPLCFLGFSSVLNIFLDILFITQLKRGIRGAAEATLLSQCLAALGMGLYLLTKEKESLPKKEHRKFSKESMENILNYAFFTALQQSVMNFGILMIQGLVNSFGTVIMAAFAAAVKIDTLAYMPAQEFANAYSIFVSQNKGATKLDRIRKGTRMAFLLSILFCLVLAVLVNLFSTSLMKLFIDASETAILREGSRYLHVEGTFYWGIGCLFLFYAYFRGIGMPSMSFVLTVVSLGTRVLLAYLFAPHFGVMAIWLAIPIGWILADLTGSWKMKSA